MPGQHVGPTQPLTLTETRNGSFNPRDAGAACRTEREVPRHAAALDRFNPRDAGAACRTSPATVTIEYFGVSIPAMPGQHVGRQALSERDDSPAVGVSI